MASSENVASIEPWMLRPVVTDSWLADYISRDTDTLTKALQKSLSDHNTHNNASFFFPNPDSSTAATPTVSSLSAGSDQESAPKRRAAPPPSGKISKRKSRASKRSQTTFITADPANFRQMVQQVTGVRFPGTGQISPPPVLKPEPQRATGLTATRFSSAAAGCLPTLDTSAFLLDHHSQQMVGPNSGAAAGPSPGLSGPGPLPFGSPLGALDAHAAASFATSADFDMFSSFPTLESWKVM